MKLGLLTACMPERTLEDIAAWAGANGYDTLEIAAWPREDDQPFTAGHLAVETFDEAETDVPHVHASANDRGAPGADHVDRPGVRDALRAIGYAGPVVIESFTAENEAIATGASIWRPLAASRDAIAVDGLAFLRRTLS